MAIIVESGSGATLTAKEEIFICANCDKKFISYKTTSKNRFCSFSCYREWRNKNKLYTYKESQELKVCEGCGIEFYGRRKYCSDECLQSTYRHQREPKNRCSKEYKEFRREVKIRDGGVCRECAQNNIINYNTEIVHHIIPVSVEPDLMMDMNNCVTLCKDCHRKTLGGREHLYVKYYREMIGKPLDSYPIFSVPRSGKHLKHFTIQHILRLHDRGFSLKEIAKHLGVHQDTVYRRLKDANITLPTICSMPSYSKFISYQLFKAAASGMGERKIAQQFNIPSKRVPKLVRIWIPNWDASMGNRAKSRGLTSKILRKLYVDKKFQIKQIARLFGLSQDAVGAAMVRYKIPKQAVVLTEQHKINISKGVKRVFKDKTKDFWEERSIKIWETRRCHLS